MNAKNPGIAARIGAVLLATLPVACRSLDVRGDETSSVPSASVRESADEEAFRKSIERSRFPWFSRETGEAKYLPREVVESPKQRPTRERRSSRGFNWADSAVKIGCWVALSIFFVVAVVAIVLAIRSMIIKNMLLKKRLAADAVARERRINALTPEAAEQYDDLFSSAKSAYDRGDYRRALIFFFSCLLVEMDKREFVLLAKGKTNLEYWRELVDFAELRSIYRATMNEFERVYFGGEPISREEFDRVWALHPRFEEIMREKDEKDRLRREAEELDRRSKGVNVSASVVLIAVVSLTSCFGCSSRKEETWKNSYGSYVSYNNGKSLNSATAYLDYCRRNTKWKLKTVPFNRMRENDFAELTKNQDAIICFDSPDYNDAPFSSPYWSGVWTHPRAKDRSALLQALEANLRRYARASDDDFDQFAVTETTFGFTLIEKEVERWLNEKPNRAFILVAGGWDALPFYLLDARQALINSGASESDSKLRECDELLSEYLRQVKSLANPVEAKEFNGDYVFPEVPWRLGRRCASLKLIFSRIRERKQELLNNPLKRAEYLLQVFDDDESGEAKESLPRELVERVVCELDAIVARKKTSRHSGGSVDMDGVFNFLNEDSRSGDDLNFDEDIASWDDLSFDEKWSVAFKTIKTRSLKDFGAYGTKNGFQDSVYDPDRFDEGLTSRGSFRNIYDDGTDWSTTSSVDEKDASPQDESEPKLPPNPCFVTRFVPSSFGDWPDVASKPENEDAFLDPRRLIRTGGFSGDPKWTEGLPEEARLREFCKIEPRRDVKVLLAQGDIPLVCERKIGGSRLLIVNSISFLSNYGLTDPVNRKLAAKLTRELPPKSRTLVFLDMLDVDSDVSERVKKEDGPFSLKRLTPFTIFIWHVVFLGACAIFCAYPIFGRPKRLRRERTNDFSRHVNAYARELQNIGARSWAQEQIDAYRNSDKPPEL